MEQTAKAFKTRNTPFKRSTLAISLGLLIQPLTWAAPPSNALPVLGNIASGTADVTRNVSQGKLTVNQQSDKLIANWNSFNVGANAQVVFNQPAASSIALNRIGSTAASQIFGQVTANGQLILVNPAGITIGSSGQISAGSVIASTLNISDSDFNAGNLIFNRGTATTTIDNQGSIKSLDGSSTLLASNIKTSGTISAKNGNINLANGNQLSIAADAVTVNQPAKVASLIQSTGTLQAQRVSNSNGRVYILGDRFENASHVDLGGNINATVSYVYGKNINITNRLNSRNSIALNAVNDLNVKQVLNLIGDNQLLSITHGKSDANGIYLDTNAQINLLGNGTKFRVNGDDYTVIRSIEELQAINSNTTSLAGKYVLGNNIDASATANWNNGAGFSPIGGNLPTGTTAPLFYFSGILNGLGHGIDGLNIQRHSDYIGLFGAAKNADIQNTKLTNTQVSGGGYVGGLIGYHVSTDQLGKSSKIINNTLSGTVSNTNTNTWALSATGGLIGYSTNDGRFYIQNNVLNVDVSGVINVAGLIGNSQNSRELSIDANSIKGSVFTGSAGAGLIANNNNAGTQSISSNSSTVVVKSAGMINEDYPGAFGGLIANNLVSGSLTIENNALAGKVEAANMKTGGLIGHNQLDGAFSKLRITNNQVTGHVVASHDYAEPENIDLQDGDAIGGLIGYNLLGGGVLSVLDNTISGNVLASGKYTGGLIGYSTNGGVLNITGNQVSGKMIGDKYIGGLLGYIDLSGSIPGDETLPSSLNITANSTSNAILGQQYVGGLIGQLNLSSAAANIQSSKSSGTIKGTDYAGGLIGQVNLSTNHSGIAPELSLLTSYSTGNISGNSFVGGLIGSAKVNSGSLLIGNTYKSGQTIATAALAGGLVAEITRAANTSARIFNSYATGRIQAYSLVGGLVGYSMGTGNLRVDRSFWDLDSTGQPASIGGTGLSSEQMKQLSTYAGWSINTNPAGGSIWYINDSVTPPTLR